MKRVVYSILWGDPPGRQAIQRIALLTLACCCGLLHAEMATRRFGTPPKAAPARAEEGRARPTGYVPRTETAPVIDGRLDDAVWAKAKPLLLARTLNGDGPAAQLTEARFLRDDKLLYVGIRCVEPLIDKIRASTRDHDGEIWSDDSVELFLGTAGLYYHLGVNAAGSTYDARGKFTWKVGGLRSCGCRFP